MIQAVNSLWCLRVKYEFLENKNLYIIKKLEQGSVFYQANIISDHIIIYNKQSICFIFKKRFEHSNIQLSSIWLKRRFNTQKEDS